MGEGNKFRRFLRRLNNKLSRKDIRSIGKTKSNYVLAGPIDYMGNIRKIDTSSPDYLMMFLDNPAVRGAVNAIVNAVTGNGYKIKTVQGQDVDTDNPKVRLISEWLEFPSKDFFSILRTIVTNLVVVDDSFIEIINHEEGKNNGWMKPLDHRYVQIHLSKDKKRIDYITYTAGSSFGESGIKFTPDEYVHASMNKLGSSLYGFSTLESLVREINLYNYVTGYHTALMESGGVPAIIYVLKSGTTKDFDLLTEMISESKAGQNLGLFGDVEINEVGISTKDMDYKEITDHIVQMVMTAFQVPPVMMSMQGSSSKETSKSEMNAFGGVIRSVQTAVNNIITTIIHKIWGEEYFDIRFTLNSWNDPASLAAIHKIYLTTGVLTPNDVRKELDLPPVEWGDKPYNPNFPAEETGLLPKEKLGNNSSGGNTIAAPGDSPSGNTDTSRPAETQERPKKSITNYVDEMNLLKIARIMRDEYAKRST